MAMSEVTLVSTEERHTVSIQGRVKMSDIPQFVGGAYSEIWMEMKRNGWEITGPPFAYYRSWSDGEVDLDCGFPVKGEVVGTDKITTIHIASGEGGKSNPQRAIHGTGKDL